MSRVIVIIVYSTELQREKTRAPLPNADGECELGACSTLMAVIRLVCRL